MAENNSTVLLASAARTATVATADQSNPECRAAAQLVV